MQSRSTQIITASGIFVFCIAAFATLALNDFSGYTDAGIHYAFSEELARNAGHCGASRGPPPVDPPSSATLDAISHRTANKERAGRKRQSAFASICDNSKKLGSFCKKDQTVIAL
jgi:hypothetical protein